MEWDNACDWPRRLLHVPTMTSYLWQPGNTYNGWREPRYNALSYTWGRWQLKEGERPEVEGLKVEGITWSTPRIDPSHFTTEELLSVIQRATAQFSFTGRGTTRLFAVRTEFVWLDIACIDQNPNSADNASEVGRQAKIFRRAYEVFAWLTSFESPKKFTKWLRRTQLATKELKRASKPAFPYIQMRPGSPSAEETILAGLHRLAEDPWFTSLWTLQEGLLGVDTHLLFKGPSDDLSGVAPSVNVHLSWIKDLLRDIQERGPSSAEELGKIEDVIKRLGVFIEDSWVLVAKPYPHWELVMNPFHLLTAYKYRNATHEEDFVYGIMQLLGLRLGKSAPNETRTNFTFSELERQLHEALLAKYPIASQLVIQPRNCRHGAGWIVQSAGVVSDPGVQFWSGFIGSGDVETWARLSIRDRGKEQWGYFNGPMISFAVLSKHHRVQKPKLDLDLKWRVGVRAAIDDRKRQRERQKSRNLWRRVLHRILVGLGRVRNVKGMLEQPRKQYKLSDDNYDNEVANSCANTVFPELMVLLLGFHNPLGHWDWYYPTAYGVCLTPCHGHTDTPCYERVGTVKFDAFRVVEEGDNDAERKSKDGSWVRRVDHEPWTRQREGFFG